MSGVWRVTGASVAGAGHLRAGEPCQDAHQWAESVDGTLIAAVADGAGSAALGGVGARAAVGAAVEYIIRQLNDAVGPADEDRWSEILISALQAARLKIEQRAEEEKSLLRELASTLIVLAANDAIVAATQVGDGAAIVSDGTSDLIAVTRPQLGEYINETTFLVSADYLEEAQLVFRRRRAQNIAIISDGLQMLALKMPGGDPYPPFFKPLFSFIADARENAPEQLAAFLRSPRITERTEDDLTLLLAARI
jgi:serine/threonine protein phosphatase PrpC